MQRLNQPLPNEYTMHQPQAITFSSMGGGSDTLLDHLRRRLPTPFPSSVTDLRHLFEPDERKSGTFGHQGKNVDCLWPAVYARASRCDVVQVPPRKLLFFIPIIHACRNIHEGLKLSIEQNSSYALIPFTFESGGRCSRVGGRMFGFADDLPRSGLEGLGHGVALQCANCGCTRKSALPSRHRTGLSVATFLLAFSTAIHVRCMSKKPTQETAYDPTIETTCHQRCSWESPIPQG